MARGGFVIPTGATAQRVQDQRNKSARSIPLDKLIPYHRENVDGHPVFRDYSADKLKQLADSLEKHGQVDNIIVFPSEVSPGYFEVLSGKQRTRAARLVMQRHPGEAEYEVLNATILDLQSVKENEYSLGDLTYVLTNVHRRDQMVISEFALAYEMQFQAEKHQGISADDKLDTLERIAQQNHTSPSFIKCARQFIPERCIPEIISLADEGYIPPSTASQTITRMNRSTQQKIYDFLLQYGTENKIEIGQLCKKKLNTPALKRLKEIYDNNAEKSDDKNIVMLSDGELAFLTANENKKSEQFFTPSKKILKSIIPPQYWQNQKAAEQYLINASEALEELKRYKEKFGDL